MTSGVGQTGELAARIAAAKERGRQRVIARGLADAGLVADAEAVEFVNEAAGRSIMDRARDSKLQPGWRRRAGWGIY